MPEDKINLLVVDDETQFLHSIGRSLEVRDFNVFTADRGDAAVTLAQSQPIDIALVDLKMPGMNGEELLRALKKEHPMIKVIILTGHGTIDSAAQCTRDGAYSYLQKPCDLNQILETLIAAYKKRVMRKQRIEEERMNKMLEISLSHSPREILGRSPGRQPTAPAPCPYHSVGRSHGRSGSTRGP